MVEAVSAVIQATAIQMSAINRLAPGPAAATQAMPTRGCLKFCGVMGTGLAQPNRNVLPVMLFRISSIPGISTVPTGSMCLMGLRVRRPSIRAVGSPSLLAIQPWATSWTVMANRSGTPTRRIFWTRLNSGIRALYRPASAAEGRGVSPAKAHDPGCLTREIHHGGRFEAARPAIQDEIHLVL